jgi:hypothetical protein
MGGLDMYWDIKVRFTGEVEDYSELDELVGRLDVNENGEAFYNKDKEPVPHPLGKQRVVELSWGWTPFGETPEPCEKDDLVGHESVFILEHQVPKLIEKLNELLR